MKKFVYIALFTLLGFLLSLLAHIGLEMLTLSIITEQMDKYQDGFIWSNWKVIHRYVGGFLTIAGLAGGLWAGWRFWRVLYVEGRKG